MKPPKIGNPFKNVYFVFVFGLLVGNDSSRDAMIRTVEALFGGLAGISSDYDPHNVGVNEDRTWLQKILPGGK